MKRNKLGLDRIIFFSDAVFAIAITLLSLDLHLPTASEKHASLRPMLISLFPEYQNYVISFIVIGFYWISHHYYFRFVQKYDYMFVGINIVLLMCIASLPFATSVLDTYGDQRSGVVFYAFCMLITGTLKVVLWGYAAQGSRLIYSRLSPQRVMHLTLKAIIPPVVFLLSIFLALLSPTLAKLSWGAIFLVFV